MALRQCAHQECECEIEVGGANFCSTYCEETAKGLSGDAGAAGCACGHAGCSGERPRLEDEDVEQHA